MVRIELQNLINEWNHHLIRHSRNAESPGGIPDVLYFLPELSGEPTMLPDCKSIINNQFIVS